MSAPFQPILSSLSRHPKFKTCFSCCEAGDAFVVVVLSCPILCPRGLQHANLLCPPLSPRVCSDSCPLSWWCYLTISSSVTFFSSCPQSFPGLGSFRMSRLFASSGQSIGAAVKEFSTFLCIGRCKSLGSLKSFLSYASKLSGANLLCVSHPESLRAFLRDGLQPHGYWLPWHSSLLIWEEIFQFLVRELRFHKPQNMAKKKRYKRN